MSIVESTITIPVAFSGPTACELAPSIVKCGRATDRCVGMRDFLPITESTTPLVDVIESAIAAGQSFLLSKGVNSKPLYPGVHTTGVTSTLYLGSMTPFRTSANPCRLAKHDEQVNAFTSSCVDSGMAIVAAKTR